MTGAPRVPHVAQLAARLGAADFDDLYRLSIDRPDVYWAGVLEALNVVWERPYDAYADLSQGAAFPRWFPGGRLNWIATVLAHASDPTLADRPAVVAQAETGDVARASYRTLVARAGVFAAELAARGLGRGSLVGLMLAADIDAVAWVLAVSWIGAIGVPLFTGFGADAAAARLAGCEALVVPDAFRRRGRTFATTALVEAIRAGAPDLKHVIPAGLEARGPAPPMEIMGPDDPFLILYTSGTSGAPKGAVHVHGGFPLKVAHDAAVHFDLGAGDVWLWPADLGWVVGSITIVGALMRGACLVLADGAPDAPGAGRLARLISDGGVTHFGASPSLVRQLAASGAATPDDASLDSLRLLITAGEVIDPDTALWFGKAFGRGVASVINYTGGTEASGALLADVVVRPILPGRFNTASPGVAADVLDGELVVRAPFVGMTRSLWRDDARYLETYWSRHPGLWAHGDLARRTGGSWEILGRADDTMKIGGKRLGPAEVEDVALDHPAVREAAAVSVLDGLKGEALVVFAVADDRDCGAAVARLIEQRLGKPFLPARVHVVDALPRTRNGKVVRRLLRALCRGEPVGDLSALENAAVVEAISRTLPA